MTDDVLMKDKKDRLYRLNELINAGFAKGHQNQP